MRGYVGALVFGMVAGTALGQSCGHWPDGFAINQLGGRVQAVVNFDDGTGAHRYVAGEFRNDEAAPGRQGIAMWNGTAYVPVGGGLDGSAWSLAVFDDDGAGPNPPALYVGGNFQHAGGANGVSAMGIAKWDGQNWSALTNGFNGTVYALKGFDDGNGPGLYAGGSFSFAGAGPAASLAVWRGGVWSEVGGGVHFGTGLGVVDCLEVFQGSLYVGGFYDNVGGLAANALARWNGSAWSTLGAGVNYGGSTAQVSRLLAVNLASTGGAALIVAGTISSAGGVASGPVARWNGASWASMNSGAGSSSSYLNALGVYDDGTGAALYAGGTLPPGSGVSKWNGSSWQLVGGIPFTTGVPLGIDCMAVTPDNKLFVGGMFKEVNGLPAPCAAVYNGTWANADGFGLGFDARIYALGVFDLGDGPRLYAGGSFASAGGVRAAGVARLGSAGWEALATPVGGFPNPDVRCMTAFDDGTGMALYVGGAISSISDVGVSNVARWRPGSYWTPVGSGLSNTNVGVSGTVYALCVHDDDGPGPHAPALYATGQFQYAGGAAVTCVAKWSGSSWQSVGTGPAPNGITGACLASVDMDGPGGQAPRLYWGGVLSLMASWDGTAWTVDGDSPQATVISCIGAFDAGDGLKLYAGGDITYPFTGSLARKNGTAWENVGNSPRFPNGGGSGGVVENASVRAMAVFDDGGGPQLYMTGIFGSIAANGYVNAARWNGSTWTGAGAGLASRFPGPDGRGTSLAVYDDGHGPALYFGGKFERFYPSYGDTGLNSWHAAYNIEKWTGCGRTLTCCADFDGDGDERTDFDIQAFFACLAGDCCPTCCSPDYNGDGDERTDADIESFFRVLAGGNC
jgi:hypothetical protein